LVFFLIRGLAAILGKETGVVRSALLFDRGSGGGGGAPFDVGSGGGGGAPFDRGSGGGGGAPFDRGSGGGGGGAPFDVGSGGGGGGGAGIDIPKYFLFCAKKSTSFFLHRYKIERPR